RDGIGHSASGSPARTATPRRGETVFARRRAALVASTVGSWRTYPHLRQPHLASVCIAALSRGDRRCVHLVGAGALPRGAYAGPRARGRLLCAVPGRGG